MILDGKRLAYILRQDISREVASLSVQPCLAVVLVGDDPASHIYVSHKQRACDEVGIRSICVKLPASTLQTDLLALINQWNDDTSVHGILVQLPLPEHLDRFVVINAVSPNKDVDGFTATNMGRIVCSQPYFLPPTPSAILHLLKANDLPLVGKHVVIINDSIVVGRPLAMMLLEEKATVTICHRFTTDLPVLTRLADVVVVAVVARPHFHLTAGHVRKGVVVIDVGINRLLDGKVVGDVDFEEVSQVASHITKVPGGVAPVTISFLLQNTVKAAKEIE